MPNDFRVGLMDIGWWRCWFCKVVVVVVFALALFDQVDSYVEA